MFVVIFELTPKPGCQAPYLDIAADLKPLLADIDGFISVERYQSLTTPEKVLSLSFWRDEQVIQRWRELEKHRDAQKQGRETLFADYKITVAEVARQYGMQK